MIGTALFAAALGLSWTISALHVLWSDRPFYLLSGRALEGRVRLARGAVLAVATVGYAAMVVAFARAGGSEWPAIGILAAMAAIRRWEIAQWPGDIVVRLGKYQPAGTCLAAWLVTQGVGRALGWPLAEGRTLGWDAACGVMAGIYVLAGIAKVRESGWVWMHPRYQALLVAERAFSGPRVLRAARLFVARSRSTAAVMGVVGLGLELGGVGFVFPALRPLLAAAIVGLHLGFFVLLGYIEVEWSLVIVAITLLAS